MNFRVLTISIIVLLATIAASFAYMPQYYMSGYGSGYSMGYYGSWIGAYQHIDGYQLTYPGSQAYPPGTRFVDDIGSRGQYSPYTGGYYNPYTGRLETQYRPYYGGVPTRYYADSSVIHYG